MLLDSYVDGSPWYPKPDDTICSEHFMGNKKSDEEENPSYAPTIFPEIYRKRKVNDSQVLARYTRLTKRRTTKVSDTTSSQIIIEEGSELNQTQPFMIDQGCQVNMFSESKLRDTTFICIRLIYSDHCDPTSRILMTNNSRKKDKSCGTDKKSYEDQSTETKSQEFVGISSITNDQELLDPSELDLILAFHCCERSQEVSKQVLDLHFTLRTLFTTFFKNRCLDKKSDLCLDTILYAPLPMPTLKGDRAVYLRLLDPDPRNFFFPDAVRTFMMVFDLWQYEEGTWPGFVLMIDMDKAVMGHITRLEIMVIRQVLYFLQVRD
ncbi:hypothetical protein evm_013936 [Chilo suppressalis]|nr:hypothetical protein evm_013936 [Chilo suppressalis]